MRILIFALLLFALFWAGRFLAEQNHRPHKSLPAGHVSETRTDVAARPKVDQVQMGSIGGFICDSLGKGISGVKIEAIYIGDDKQIVKDDWAFKSRARITAFQNRLLSLSDQKGRYSFAHLSAQAS